jgi:hypothetical protein
MHNDLILMFTNIHMTDLTVLFLSVGVLYAAGYAVVRVGSSALYILKERRYLASEGAAFQGKASFASSRLQADFGRTQSDKHISA